MSDPATDVREVWQVLRECSALPTEDALAVYKPSFPVGATADAYCRLMRLMPEQPDVLAELRGVHFRPFFLLNGLILAANYHHVQSFVLRALASGLEQCAAYLVHLHADHTGAAPDLERQQKRFMAFCIAQLSECGMPMEGLFQTLKGDVVDQGASAQLRTILEEGPPALAASSVFTDEEKRLWSAIFANEPVAWTAMQHHLVTEYGFTFVQHES